MQAKKTKRKGDKANFNDFGDGSMGQKMFEMMGRCCAGRGGNPDCSTVMEGMMETMKKQSCCTSNDAAGGYGRKKK